MFHIEHLFKKLKTRPISEAGLKLTEEKHEQNDSEIYQLLVANRQLYCQFQHGISLVYAGDVANWLRSAICYTPLRGVALSLPRMALSIGCGLFIDKTLIDYRSMATFINIPHLMPCSCTAAWVTCPSSLPRAHLCAGDTFKQSEAVHLRHNMEFRVVFNCCT